MGMVLASIGLIALVGFGLGVAGVHSIAGEAVARTLRGAPWRIGRKTGSRLTASERERRWGMLKWCSIGTGTGGVLGLYVYWSSVLGGVSFLVTTLAVTGLLFAVRREQSARSYARGGRRQQRRAARLRAAWRRRAEKRRRQRRASAARTRSRRSAEASRGQPPREVIDALNTLRLSEGASREEVQRAYRQQAMRHHPDRYAQHSETVQAQQKERFQDVQQARATLDRYYTR